MAATVSLLVVLAGHTGAGPADAAGILITTVGPAVYSFPAAFQPHPAAVDIKPERLESQSGGVPVTAFVELGPGALVETIVTRSVRLCVGQAPCADGVAPGGKPKIGDADGDGLREVKLVFDRQAVQALLTAVSRPASIDVTVSGLLGDGWFFAGSDSLRLEP